MKCCERCGKPRKKRAGRFCSPACFAAWKLEADPRPKFWRQVKKTETCWLWTGHHDGRWYGSLIVRGKPMKAHRFAWELAHGSIPKELDCCHVCDVKLCVRIDHLFLGTAQDNINDMMKKGRHRPRRGGYKLTPDTVRLIRAERAAGVTTIALAKRFGVSPAVISGIALRKIWKHVPDHGSPVTVDAP